MVKLADYFVEDEVHDVLEGIFERQGSPNQITLSGEMEDVLEDLFDKTLNLEGLNSDWKEFINKLIEVDNEKYKRLQEKYIEIYRVCWEL